MKRFFVFLIIIIFTMIACRLSNTGSKPPAGSSQEGTPVAQASATPVSPEMGVTPTQTPSAAPCIGLSVASVTTLIELGGNVDWSPDGKWIAYDAPDANNWTQTWIMRSDGSEKTCLTCNNSAFPTPLHIGNPTWHPAQKWIVVQAVEQPFYDGFPSADSANKQRIMDVGVGVGNDLWAMSVDGSQFIKLTDVWGESRWAGGVLHPHFSHDGRILAWTQRVENTPGDPGGAWVIKIADFILENDLPHLANLRTLKPWSGEGVAEVHSFSPDDSLLLFTTNADGQPRRGFDIYSLDLATNRPTRLTNTPNEWDEHAQYSPDGRCIAWMSSRNAGAAAQLLKTEMWLMSADGSEQKQLTTFNDPNSKFYLAEPYGVVVADSSWSPDGRQLLVYVIVNQGDKSEYSMPGKIVLLTLE